MTPIKKAYIILAHKQPVQLKRLVDSLSDGVSDFFVHIDLKSDGTAFENALAAYQSVSFVRREKTVWGGFGIVQATLHALRAIEEKGMHPERIVLLSGQDYPIKSNEHIDKFFAHSQHSVFIDYFSLPNHTKWGKGGGQFRVNKHFMGMTFRERHIAKSFNFLAAFIPALRRYLPRHMKPYAGSQWWVIDYRALRYILQYVDENEWYSSFHKRTFAPDELFFHMILVNSNDDQLKSSIENNNLRFIKWASGTIAHPELLTQNDLSEIRSSKALFARKFDTSTDSLILDLIDEQCRHTNKVIAKAS